jgi:hypothetical protein
MVTTTGQLDVDTGQDWLGSASGDRPTGCSQRLHEDVTFASKLHAVALFLCLFR